MSDLFGSTKIGAFGDRMQLFGLASQFDTKTILEAELNLMRIRQQPQYDKKTSLEKEKAQWNTLRTNLTNFQASIKSVTDLVGSNKTAASSQEGFLVAKADNNAIDGTYDITVSQIATNQRVSGDRLTGGALGFEGESKLNGKVIEITSDMSLRDIAMKINAGEYGAGAIVLDDQIVITSKTSGLEGKLEFEGPLWEGIGIMSGGLIKNEIQEAKDAVYTINGIPMTSSTNEIKDIEGVTFEIKKETVGAVTIEVEGNSKETMEKVQELVKSYNSVVNLLNNISGEGGIFQGERIPRNIKRSMNEIIYNVQQEGAFLSDIGIGLDRDAKNGSIRLDEKKFEEFFSKDPIKGMELITGEGGFTSKMNEVIDRFVSERGEIKTETTGLDSRLDRVIKSIERFEMDFERQKDVLIKKYATFETMMSGLQLQSDYLMAQLGQFEMDSRR